MSQRKMLDLNQGMIFYGLEILKAHILISKRRDETEEVADYEQQIRDIQSSCRHSNGKLQNGQICCPDCQLGQVL